MKLTDDELSDEYKLGVEHLTQFLADREEWRETIRAAELRGHKVDPKVHADTMAKLREFDTMIDDLETKLAVEYDRIVAEKKKEAELSTKIDEMVRLSKELYIHVKYETPHLLDSFTERVLGPMDDDEREEFLDDVAILEATKLDAILKGEN